MGQVLIVVCFCVVGVIGVFGCDCCVDGVGGQ